MKQKERRPVSDIDGGQTYSGSPNKRRVTFLSPVSDPKAPDRRAILKEKVLDRIGLRLFDRRNGCLQLSRRFQNATLQAQTPVPKRSCRLLRTTDGVDQTLQALGNLRCRPG